MVRHAIAGTRKSSEAMSAASDQFCTVPFIPSGTPYPEAMALLNKITHSGDKLPASAGRDAPQFIHDSTPCVTTTHTNHTLPTRGVAATRTAAKAMCATAASSRTMPSHQKCSPTLHAHTHNNNNHSHTHTLNIDSLPASHRYRFIYALSPFFPIRIKNSLVHNT